MPDTEKISPKELSRIFLEAYDDAESVDHFIRVVTERSGIVMLRYFLAAVYYAIDMAKIG